MYQSNSRRTTSRGALLAVLQSFLLLSVLVLTPASVIAQEGDAMPSQAPEATEPAAEPNATALPDRPGPTADRQASRAADESAPKAEPKSVDAPSFVEPELKLRLYPRQIKLFPGGKKVVSAWTCPADVGASFGPDKEPGTADDACTKVRAKWSLEAADSGRLSNVFGLKTRITLLADSDIDVRAQADGLIGKGRVIAKEEPAADRPQAVVIEPTAVEPVVEEPSAAPVDEPVIDEPVIDEPPVDEPPADPSEEPTAAEPSVAPSEEPVASEAPVIVEPSAEPTTEPTAKPKSTNKNGGSTATFVSPFAIAADIGVVVEAQMDSGTGDCIKFLPQGSGSQTTFVKATDSQSTAWTAHGSSAGCPSGPLSLTTQSALGFSPTAATIVPTGTPFTLGQMTHSNNPIQGENFFNGTLNIRLFGTTLDFPWTLWETPNEASPCAIPGTTRPCDDRTTFSDTIGDQAINVGGVDYQLVLLGFNKVGEGNIGSTPPSCPAYDPNAVVDSFITEESTANYGCLYAELVQVRSLTIEKVKAGAAGGSPDFDFSSTSTLGNQSPWGGRSWDLAPGQSEGPIAFLPSRETVVVTEDVPSGWSLTDVSCVDGTGGTIPGSQYSVNLDTGRLSLNDIDDVADGAASAAPIVCTFTNRLDTGTLIVEKVVVNDNGADAIATDFAFDVAGPSAQGPVPFAQLGANELLGRNTLSVDAGTYTVTETQPIMPGYSVSYDNCSNVVVGPGATQTCTITNDDDPAGLILRKTVINDNGGSAAASAWTLSAGTNSVPGSAAGALATSVAGTYALSESGPDGYSNTSLTCDNSTGQVSSVTVGLGETVTCTFVNDDDPAGLILRKTVINDNGGSAAASAWTLSAGTNSVPGSAAGALATSVAGTYALSESGPDGYSNTSLTCDNSTGQVSSVTVGLGETVTCTFVNDDDPAGLILRKTVINDNGGSAAASAWTLSAGTNSVPGSAAGALATSVAGTYALSESGPDGYSNTSLTCDNSTGQVSSVTVGLGETVTCTFVNDDDPAGLILRKTVINDNGGSAAASAWTLSAGTNSVPGSAAGALATSVAGTYALSESGPDGYSNTSLTCDNSTGQVSSVTVGLGETVTCTFVNDDDPAGLILRKTVINDNGGSAAASAWTLSAGTNSVPGSAAGALATSVAGTYALSESGPDGYSNTSLTCDNSTGQVSSVTVGLGETVTCTFVNDDDPAGLILRKTVINDNGGSAAASAWTLSAGTNSVPGSAAGALATSVAGTYALSESGPDGYSNTSLTCDNSTGQVSSVTVGLGETVTCTFVNDDDPATLTLVKTVSGGDATADDFDPFIDAQQVTWGTPVDLAPGGYTASEVMNVSDYVAGAWGGDCDAQGNVTIALGDALTCTVTNYHAELEITKSADPGFYAAAGDLISYTITATNSGMATLTNVDVSDALIDGLDSWECTPEIPATLAPGESITCTASYEISEADVEAGSVPNTACAISAETSQPVCDDETVYLSELEIVKSADVDYFSAAGDLITYTVIATNTGEFTLTDVDISDDLIDGLDSWVCTPTLVVAELASGESVTCTATYEVTEADVEAGSVPNVACAVSDQTPEVCDDLDIPLAQLEIEKSADPLTYSAVGDEIAYTVVATNTGEATLTDVDISDDLIDGLDDWACTVGNAATGMPVAQLASGQAITCTATYTVTEADVTGTDPEGFITNVACVDSDQTPEVCDQVTSREIVVELVKSVTPAVLAEPGGVFTYTLFIDNESAVPVEITALVDDNSALSADWAANCAVLVGTVLGPDGPGDADAVTCSYSVERTDAGIYPNTAQVTVVDSIGTAATAEDDQSVEVTDVLPEIVVTKTASTGYVEAPGADVEFTFVVRNLSVEPVTITSLSDDVFGTLAGDADCQVGTILGVGASCEFSQTFFVSGVGGELHVNVFTATADDDDGNEATDDDDAEIVIQYPLEIVIQKTPSRNNVLSGGEVTFTFEFSHPLPISLYLSSLEDDVFGDLLDENNLGPQGDPNVELVPGSNTCAAQDVGFELLPGATYTCELKAIISGDAGYLHVNTVEIIASDIDPTAQPEPGSPEPRFTSWSDDATVKVVEPEISGDPVTPKPTLPPTDMLLLTDSSGDDQSGGFGDPMSWAIWVLLSALLILSTAFVLRRQRYAEVRSR